LAISPIRNNGHFNLYISYTHSFLFPELDPVNSINILYSSNSGENFIDLISELCTPGFNPYGSSISVGMDGEISVAWANMDESNDDGVESITICDSRNNYSQHVYSTRQIGSYFKLENSEAYYIKDKRIRVDSFPRISVNPLSGDFYVTWAGKQGTNEHADILLVKGTKQPDKSIAWDSIKKVIDNSSGDQFMPAISVAPNGVISVFLYTTADDAISTPIYGKINYSSNNGGSFTPKPVFGGFSFSDMDNNLFIGDYHGVASWLGKVYAFFCQNKDHGAYNKRQVYCHIISDMDASVPSGWAKVEADQLDAFGQSFEQFERWNKGLYTSYTPPINFVFKMNNTEIIKAKQEYKQNSYEKFNEWEELVDIKNHKIINIIENNPDISSKFKSTKNCILSTNLISGGSGAEIEFKDPWLILQESAYNEPPYGYRNLGMDSAEFRPFVNEVNINHSSEYKGVFLNQEFDPEEPNKPNYTVRAKFDTIIQFHGQNLTWYFQEWQDNGKADIVSSTQIIIDPQTGIDYFQTPVVFTDDNAEVTAVYKGHGASDTWAATGYNNSRRIVHVPNSSTYHLVYTDGGQVWHTYTTNGGQSWQPEKRISAPGTQNCNPAIAGSIPPNFPYSLNFVWEETYDYLGTVFHRINFIEASVPASGPITYGAIQNISNEGGNLPGAYESNEEMRPSLYINPLNCTWIAWRSKINGQSTYKVYIKKYEDHVWSYGGQVNGANNFPVVASVSNGDYKVRIIWIDGATMKYISGRYLAEDWLWTTAVTLNTDLPGYYTSPKNPSVSVDYNFKGHIAWEGRNTAGPNGGYNTIFYRSYDFMNNAAPVSGSFTQIASCSYSPYNYLNSPVISYDPINSYITIFYYYYGNIYRKQKTTGWNSSNFGEGRYPCISVNKSSGAVWTAYSPTPYLLKTELTGGLLQKDAVQNMACILAKRFTYPVAEPDSDYFSIDLEHFKINDESFSFDENLNTDTLVINGSARVEMQWQYISDNFRENTELTRLYFNTTDRKYLIETIDSEKLIAQFNDSSKAVISKNHLKLEVLLKRETAIWLFRN